MDELESAAQMHYRLHKDQMNLKHLEELKKAFSKAKLRKEGNITIRVEFNPQQSPHLFSYLKYLSYQVAQRYDLIDGVRTDYWEISPVLPYR